MKLDITNKFPIILTSHGSSTASQQLTSSHSECEEAQYLSHHKPSKRKGLSKHKNTGSTFASDSSSHRSSSRNMLEENLSTSSTKKARRNINFDELLLQCPELEVERCLSLEALKIEKKYVGNKSVELKEFSLINGVTQTLQPQNNINSQINPFGFLCSQNKSSFLNSDSVNDKSENEHSQKKNESHNENGSQQLMNNLSFSQFDSINTQNKSIHFAESVDCFENNPSNIIQNSQNFMLCFSQLGNSMNTFNSENQNSQNNNSNQIANSQENNNSEDTQNSNNNNNNNINSRNFQNNENIHLESRSTFANQLMRPQFPRMQRRAFGDITEAYNSLKRVGKSNETAEEVEEEEEKIIQESQYQAEEEEEEGDLEEEEESEYSKEMELFNPVDDINFIDHNDADSDYLAAKEEEEEEEGYQDSLAYSNKNNKENMKCQQKKWSIFHSENIQKSQNNSENHPVPNNLLDAMSNPTQSMEEQLANFDEDETFGFDSDDKQILNERDIFYTVDADALLNYNSNFTNFPKKRAILLDWMQEVSSSLQFKRETYQQSVSIVDRFFQKIPLVPKDKLQLVGATALLISHKIEVIVCVPENQLIFYQEVTMCKIQDFIMACNYGYSHEQFLEMEQNICQTLEFFLSSPTIYFWMNQLMMQWDVFSEQFEALFENDVIYFKRNTHQSFLMFSSVCQYLDCSLYDIKAYYFDFKSLAASFMYWAIYQSIDLANNPIRLSYLDQIFEKFLQESLDIPLLEYINEERTFSSQYLSLVINQQIPTCRRDSDPSSNNYQSYENVCSQQIYNQDGRKFFNS